METILDEADIRERIVAALRSQMGRPRRPVTDATDLERDLGMTGDDAFEFMVWFKNEFAVDMRNFEFSRHFGSEGFSPVELFAILFDRLIGRGYKHARQPVTIGMLISAAKSKEWPMS